MNSKEWREWKWQRPGDVSGDRFDALLFDLEAAEKAAPDGGLREALDKIMSKTYFTPLGEEAAGWRFGIAMVKGDIRHALQSPAPQGTGEELSPLCIRCGRPESHSSHTYEKGDHDFLAAAPQTTKEKS